MDDRSSRGASQPSQGVTFRRPASGSGVAGGSSNGGGPTSRELATSPSFGVSGGGTAGKGASHGGGSSRSMAASPSTPYTSSTSGGSSNTVTIDKNELRAMIQEAGREGAEAALEARSQVRNVPNPMYVA